MAIHRRLFDLPSLVDNFTLMFCARRMNTWSNDGMRIQSEIVSPNNIQASVEVMTNGAQGISKSVILRTPSSRVFFNCGESIDRCMKGSIDAMFFTYLDWSRVGGVQSFCHKFANRNKEVIPFHGPPGLDVFLAASNNFIPTEDFKIDVVDFDPHSGLSYGNLRVFCIALKDREKKQIHFDPKIIDNTIASKARRSFVRNTSILKRQAQNHVALDTSFSYICQYESQRAWILSECVKRGVKAGPDMKKLWNGEDIVLDDGTLVRPADVITPETTSTIIVVDCPSEGYVEDLIEGNKYEEYFKTKNSLTTLIVHFTPSSVMKDKRYVTWMQSCPENSKHLIVNDSNDWNTSVKVVNRQEVCKLICPKLFPELEGLKQPKTPLEEYSGSNEPSSPSFESEENTDSWLQKWSHLTNGLNLIQARCKTIIDLRNLDVVRQSESFLLSNKCWLLDNTPVCKDQESMQNNTKSPNSASKRFPVVTFLGTCSQGSSAYRNSSGILVQLNQDKAMLLDCGDGIMHQLVLLYNHSKLQKVLATLKCIYLSHCHSDHHAGVISVLQGIRKANVALGNESQKVVLLAPEPILGWLEFYHKNFEPVLENCIVICLSDLIHSFEVKTKVKNLLKEMLDMRQVELCKAIHCAFSYCISFEHAGGWKISYSGDTMPSNYFIRIGQNSDLLIHEATYSSKMGKAAKMRSHSTVKDAIQVANRMNAKHVILTHFSKRHPVIPCLEDLNNSSNVSIAFDFLQISLKDLPLLPKLNDSYKIVFKKYDQENEEGNAKSLLNVLHGEDSGHSRSKIMKFQSDEAHWEKVCDKFDLM